MFSDSCLKDYCLQVLSIKLPEKAIEETKIIPLKKLIYSSLNTLIFEALRPY